MAKQYFVWKDPNCNGINPEWVQLSGREFYMFANAKENRGRYFVTLDDGGCEEANILVLEATNAVYKNWHTENKAATRLRKKNAPYEGLTISLDELNPSYEDMTYHETIAMDQPEVADIVIHGCNLNQLHHFLASLSDEEMELINALYLKNQENRSERAIAKEMGIAHMTLVNRRKKIFKKF